MERILLKIYDRHDEWVYMVEKYGCNRDTAEDIVQDMYIRVIKYLQKTDNDISFDDDVNLYFVAKTLKSTFIDHIRREKRKDTVSFDAESYRVTADNSPNYTEYYEKVQSLLDGLYWFDKKVYEIIESGTKVSTLSEKTTIPYYTLYHTYKRVKQYLIDNI